ncbi:MAG: DMT family transporter [Alphaproteobacteria bacterium]|nr:DMT family transporter [Alphaproteobacteria bacterium]
MWLLFAFTGPVLWAVSTHIDKYLVDKYFRDSNTAVLLVFTAFLGVFALPVIWLFEPKVLSLPWLATVVMTVSGILYMGAILFYLQAIQSEEASVVAPLFQANTVFTFALGLVFLHELPRWQQLAGAGLVVGGALGLSLDKTLHFGSFKPKLVLLMWGATFVLALSSVVFKFFAVHDEFWSTTFWTFVGEGLFGAGILAVPKYRKQFAHLFRKNPGAVIGVNAANELINLGGGLGVRYASLLAPVGLVSAISATSTFFVFLFGILLTLFFPRIGREDLSARNVIQKAVGGVLIMAGVVLIQAYAAGH